MNTTLRYPRFNDPPSAQRPILSMYGDSALAELVWAAIPVIALALVAIVR